nr:PREDICTED: uncharacterized protein LOC106706444 [Latimeria chalumnae]|eukprot:XP_014352912.1 PREDICTED: uncharacterized protein LOC106706444 [Latimeria chalumnae]
MEKILVPPPESSMGDVLKALQHTMLVQQEAARELLEAICQPREKSDQKVLLQVTQERIAPCRRQVASKELNRTSVNSMLWSQECPLSLRSGPNEGTGKIVHRQRGAEDQWTTVKGLMGVGDNWPGNKSCDNVIKSNCFKGNMDNCCGNDEKNDVDNGMEDYWVHGEMKSDCFKGNVKNNWKTEETKSKSANKGGTINWATRNKEDKWFSGGKNKVKGNWSSWYKKSYGESDQITNEEKFSWAEDFKDYEEVKGACGNSVENYPECDPLELLFPRWTSGDCRDVPAKGKSPWDKDSGKQIKFNMGGEPNEDDKVRSTWDNDTGKLN